jgi:hypothetical protein
MSSGYDWSVFLQDLGLLLPWPEWCNFCGFDLLINFSCLLLSIPFKTSSRSLIDGMNTNMLHDVIDDSILSDIWPDR